MNQLINVAMAEKLSAIWTESFFRERARRGNIPEAIGILNRMGKGNPPMEGDELPKTALPHEYQFNMDDPACQEALNRILPFLESIRHRADEGL